MTEPPALFGHTDADIEFLLSQVDDSLRPMDLLVDWERFRPRLERVWGKTIPIRRYDGQLLDIIPMFKLILLATIYRLPDARISYLASTSFRFRRFVGLRVPEIAPHKKIIRAYRIKLARASELDPMVAEVDALLAEWGYGIPDQEVVDFPPMFVRIKDANPPRKGRPGKGRHGRNRGRSRKSGRRGK